MCNSDKRLGFFFNHSIHETIHSSTASSTVLCTHQVVSGSVHLMAPLDGAVKLLVVVELLLDGCLIVSPGSCFNQTLEHQTRRNMYFIYQNIWEKDRRTIDSQLSEAHMFSSDMSVVFSNTCLIWISCHQQVVAEKQIGSGLFFSVNLWACLLKTFQESTRRKLAQDFKTKQKFLFISVPHCVCGIT